MTTVAITGASGRLGRRLVEVLIRRPDISRVVGLDRRSPSGLTSSRFVHRPSDVTDPAIGEALRGVDVVVHLATRIDARPDEAAMRALNVDGTRNLVLAAEAAGVERLVHLSSVAAYGAAPDNDLPLTEASELRGTPGFPFAEQQRDVERWLEVWASEDHDLRVTVLRSAMVIGPGIDNLATRLLEAPRFVMIRGHEPPLQVVHLDDLVGAIVHVIDRELAGTYNVSAEGWLAFDQIRAMVGRPVVAIPEELAFTVSERLWKLGLGEYPPGLVAHLMHPWVMSPAKLIATGWQPHITNRAALAEAVADHADYVAAAGFRTRWSTIRRAAAGAATVGLVLLAFGIRGWRRRRRRAAAPGTATMPGTAAAAPVGEPSEVRGG